MAVLSRFVAVFLMGLFLAKAAFAQTILIVEIERDGKITRRVSYSEADLREIGIHQVKTENAYVDGLKTFEGPLLRDLAARLGVLDFKIAYMIAENDYTVDIPMREIITYDVILAIAADGVDFSPRDKGPIWVIYPMSEHKELQEPKYNGRLIWQLDRIVFK
jgi:hypothetical protein